MKYMARQPKAAMRIPPKEGPSAVPSLAAGLGVLMVGTGFNVDGSGGDGGGGDGGGGCGGCGGCGG